MHREITLRVVLQQPPPGVDFGVQKGQGTGYETIQTQQSTGSDLAFEFGVGVREPDGQAGPDFRGPFVQGPRGGRFVYIDIGTMAGQQNTCWSRRLKIPLSAITWDMVNRTAAASRTVLEARLPGTARDGSPTCATPKVFDGWKIRRPRD
jgi:hypothetical protein